MTTEEIKSFITAANHLDEMPCTLKELEEAAEKSNPFGDYFVNGVKISKVVREDPYRVVYVVCKKTKKSSLPKFNWYTTPEENFNGK